MIIRVPLITLKTCVAALTMLCIIFTGMVWAAERLSVKVSVANIRSGPGTNYDVLWKVEKYHPLKIIKKSGEWYQFSDFEGDKGWIYKTLVSSTPSVIVKKDNCNIRSGPGTNFDIVFRAARGVVFKVLKRKGSWIHIRHADGDEGWIYKTLVW